jgi:hypothetical protein
MRNTNYAGRVKKTSLTVCLNIKKPLLNSALGNEIRDRGETLSG